MDVVVHAFNPEAWQAEAGSSTKQVLGQPGETLSLIMRPYLKRANKEKLNRQKSTQHKRNL